MRTLGPNEARVILTATADSQTVISYRRVLEGFEGDRNRAATVLRGLVRKGWLIKLGAGLYAVVPPDRGPDNMGENNALAMACASLEPSYVGWWSAAAFHGFTTQRPSLITIAAKRQVAARLIEGTRVRYVKLIPRKFFGSRAYDLFGRALFVSDPAKTLVDCIDRPDLCGGVSELARIAFGAKGEVDPEEFLASAVRMESVSLVQRGGFLMDFVGWEMPSSLREAMRRQIPKSARSVFGRRDPKPGDVGYVPHWGLIVHASQKELTADSPLIVKERS